MNCAIDSCATEKRCVRRVNNRVNFYFGNIGAYDLDFS
jgi:hypothetical protein